MEEETCLKTSTRQSKRHYISEEGFHLGQGLNQLYEEALLMAFV